MRVRVRARARVRVRVNPRVSPERKPKPKLKPKTSQPEPSPIALARTLTLTKMASEGRLLQRELRTASFAMRSTATLPHRLPEGGKASPGPNWIMKQAYNPNRMTPSTPTLYKPGPNSNPNSIALAQTLALTR